MTTLTAQQIFEIFVHRKDVFAKQFESGVYFPQKRPITIQDIQDHIDGKYTYGLYCLDTDNTVKWGCIDLDGDTSLLALVRLNNLSKRIYELFPEYRRMREFSGRKGFHIWIFFSEPINAGYAKQLIKSRLTKESIFGHEIFPKQTELNENRKFGNLVKIPMAKHRVSGKRSKILEMEGFRNV